MAVVDHRARVMGSDLRIVLVDPLPGQLDQLTGLLARLEARWSRFLRDSDISRINDAAGSPVAVDPDTVVLVEAMIEAWRFTHGRFDPTVLPVLVATGYAVSRVDRDRRTVLPAGPYRIGAMGDVEVDGPGGTVSVPVGVAIDPGGIGKGLAADLAVARAVAGGAPGCLVSIGGDLAMGGASPDVDGWLVAVERVDPADGELCRLAVSGGGVATSSTRSRRWVHEGHPIHHVIDPATGRPSDTDLASVTIVDRTAWRAEAHATAALLAGSASVLDHLRRDQLTGVVVSDDGRILHTRDLDGVEFRLPSGVE